MSSKLNKKVAFLKNDNAIDSKYIYEKFNQTNFKNKTSLSTLLLRNGHEKRGEHKTDNIFLEVLFELTSL